MEESSSRSGVAWSVAVTGQSPTKRLMAAAMTMPGRTKGINAASWSSGRMRGLRTWDQ